MAANLLGSLQYVAACPANIQIFHTFTCKLRFCNYSLELIDVEYFKFDSIHTKSIYLFYFNSYVKLRFNHLLLGFSRFSSSFQEMRWLVLICILAVVTMVRGKTWYWDLSGNNDRKFENDDSWTEDRLTRKPFAKIFFSMDPPDVRNHLIFF